MSKIYFDFSAPSNGVGTSSSPYNVMTAYTPVAGDQLYFRRGTSYTGSFSLTAGLAGQRTKYLAWYYPDGSDEPSQPKPVFNLSASVSSYSSTNKDNVEIQNLDIEATNVTAAANTSLIYLGHNSKISFCIVNTNVGAIDAGGKSNVEISNNVITGVTHAAAVGNNNVVSVADSKIADSVSILSNTIIHGGGGSTNSHGIRCECSVSNYDLTNLIIDGNTISPAVGVAYNANLSALGIRLQRCPGASVTNNNVHGMLEGVFVVGGGNPISVYIGRNNFSYNMNFGIHLTTDTQGCVLEYNTCSYNGTSNTAANNYGRGIEMTSAAGQGRCGYHTVRFNTCNFNKNYGGPSDNGSEGVGIGLDDGCVGCYVYGNTLISNEGNGIQQYGGNSTVTWTETGGNYIIANFLQNNCTNSFVNRRSGGTGESVFIAHISMASAYGRASHVANNVIVGSKLGVSITSNCTNVNVSNNIFYGVANGVEFDGTPSNCYNNIFWVANLSSMVKYCTMTAVTNGPMLFTAISFTGVADSSSNPLLDVNYRPMVGSPAIAAGKLIIGPFVDASGRAYKDPPSIGMYENYTSNVQPLHL